MKKETLTFEQWVCKRTIKSVPKKDEEKFFLLLTNKSEVVAKHFSFPLRDFSMSYMMSDEYDGNVVFGDETTAQKIVELMQAELKEEIAQVKKLKK